MTGASGGASRPTDRTDRELATSTRTLITLPGADNRLTLHFNQQQLRQLEYKPPSTALL